MQKTTKKAIDMNINTGGIIKKAEAHADLLAFLAAGYYRFDGDLDRLMKNYTSKDFLQNLRWALRNPKYFLWDSDHLYTSLFKGGVWGYLLMEMGIIPSKHKQTIEKVLWGSGIAAMTLPEGA